MLVFDEQKHEYIFNGVPVPNVTSILESAGLSDFSGIPQRVLELASLRGKYVHKATELYDLGELDEDSLDPIVAGYLNGWKKFITDFQPEIIDIERRLYCQKYHYAGTLDRLATINKKCIMLDIKSGAHSHAHAPQLAAYDHAHPLDIDERWTVYLSEDGQYKINKYSGKEDFIVFLSALNIHNYKNKRK